MKKYTILGLCVVAAIAVIGGLSAWLRPAAVSASLYTMTAHTVRHTVEYTGKVESAESKSVYTAVPCVADEVLVKTGQLVEKGDVLFTVDEDATRQVAATLGGQQLSALENPELPADITAPVRGIVTTLNVDEGDMTDNTKPSVVISSGEALQVKVGIPEKGLSHIYVGQDVSISGVAFDKGVYTGEVTAISPSARTQISGTATETVVDATIAIDPEEVDESLRIGLSAKASITLEVAPHALVAPYEAVLQDEEGQEYVYLYEGGQAVKRVVTTGIASEEGFEIIEGLQSGDQIIATPEKIKESGTAVTAA